MAQSYAILKGFRFSINTSDPNRPRGETHPKGRFNTLDCVLEFLFRVLIWNVGDDFTFEYEAYFLQSANNMS
jgi:hypothetical protein